MEIYLLGWVISSLLARKFRKVEKSSFFRSTRPYLVSFFLMLGILTFGINYYDYNFSRIMVGGSLLTAFTIEVGILFILSLKSITSESFKGLIESKSSFLLEFISFTWIMIFTLLYKMHLSKPIEYYLMLVFSSYLVWFLSSVLSHNFPTIKQEMSFFRSSWNYLAAYTLIISGVLFILFLLNIRLQNKLLYVSGMLIYALWSYAIFSLRYLYVTPRKTDEVSPNIFSAPTIELEETGIYKQTFVAPSEKYEVNPNISHSLALKEKLEKVYLKNLPNIFTFIDKIICLKRIDILKAMIIRSADSYNVEVLPDNSFELFVNLHEMNDIRRLNQYFIEINKKLIRGGVFIGTFEPVRFRHKRFQERYPFLLAKGLYFFDFIWRRVFPKLPILKKIYFTLTQGKDRAISMAECFGRLYYCGFEIIENLVDNNMVYFIVKKIEEPIKDGNPSYGPLFKMKRIGKGGKPLFVYKFRTMHPYSEYLQKYVYEKNSLQEGGKLKDDFRITYWGKIFRKMWIDELPMLLNFLKGELKIVGVRPLSSHYLSLYTEELKEKRKLVKPGLVPPFYYDMPKTIEEIMASETRYIDSYLKNPILTDIRYFFKAFYNIAIKKARSA